MNPISIDGYALRRRLRGEVLDLQEVAEQSGQKDSTTTIIQNWATRFFDALKTSVDEKIVLQGFIPLLQDAVKDPHGVPLEERSFLGSDGNPYGYKALCVYLSRNPRQFKGGSSFYVAPNLVVEKSIKWLKSYHANLPLPAEIENAYEKLEKVPKIPDRKRVERQQRALAFASEMKVDAETDSQEKTKAFAKGVFEGIDSEIERVGAKEKELLAALRQKEITKLRKLQDNLEEWKCDVKETENQLAQHEGDLKSLNDQISQNEKDTVQLRSAIEQTKNEIAARDSKEYDGLTTTVISIGIGLAIKYALPETAAAQPTVTPAPDGHGALLGLSRAI